MIDGESSSAELVRTVAYCGLICGVCRNATPQKGNCKGCHAGGGDGREV